MTLPTQGRAPWTELRPALRAGTASEAFTQFAALLGRTLRRSDPHDAIERDRRSFAQASRDQALLAAGLLLADLAVQGWNLRVRQGRVEVRPPAQLAGDRAAEKERVRRQELVRRNAQLRQPSVRKFVLSMERSRIFDGKFVSIFSLFRDGRDLSHKLRQALAGGADLVPGVIAPYLQFVTSEEATCAHTGLPLGDVWRYFRHTWTNQYTSVPGRSVAFLVRDGAASFHPIVGLGAISSPVMQIRERDSWIGWQPDRLIAQAQTRPTASLAKWLVRVVREAIGEIHVADLLEDGVLTVDQLQKPDAEVFERLLAESAEQRRQHHRFARARDHKAGRNVEGDEHWSAKARTHLFRSKRALALASYLSARAVLEEHFAGQPTAARLAALASSRRGCDAIRKIVRKAKADRIGIAVADITVCGAVQPYNALLGGKLVAMLATSPEVVLEYRRRYSGAESEIASSIAGRSIVREPTLVLLTTTSLYGVGSSQYNRVRIPCERVGGRGGDQVRYEELGRSEAFGTSHYSDTTIRALVDLVQQSENGQRVNSIFGEGVSPKLRKLRQGLDLLNLPADRLLRHYRHRVVYAVSLARNAREFLLGVDQKPQFLFPLKDSRQGTARIAQWWAERWLGKRVQSDEVLAEVARHTMVRPVRHGARVAALLTDQQLLFPETD